ncbi:hypothetical protein PENTCL1PPCAC_14328, partial [Pristionchus entomophagus]
EFSEIILQNIHDFSWIKERGAFFKFPDVLFLHAIIRTAILVSFHKLKILMVFFWHMFYVLRKETRNNF